MIPSINALKFVIQLLLKIEHAGKLDAMGYDRVGDAKNAESLRGQSHDIYQVVTFLEDRLAERTIFPEKKVKAKKK